MESFSNLSTFPCRIYFSLSMDPPKLFFFSIFLPIPPSVRPDYPPQLEIQAGAARLPPAFGYFGAHLIVFSLSLPGFPPSIIKFLGFPRFSPDDLSPFPKAPPSLPHNLYPGESSPTRSAKDIFRLSAPLMVFPPLEGNLPPPLPLDRLTLFPRHLCSSASILSDSGM